MEEARVSICYSLPLDPHLRRLYDGIIKLIHNVRTLTGESLQIEFSYFYNPHWKNENERLQLLQKQIHAKADK